MQDNKFEEFKKSILSKRDDFKSNLDEEMHRYFSGVFFGKVFALSLILLFYYYNLDFKNLGVVAIILAMNLFVYFGIICFPETYKKVKKNKSLSVFLLSLFCGFFIYKYYSDGFNLIYEAFKFIKMEFFNIVIFIGVLYLVGYSAKIVIVSCFIEKNKCLKSCDYQDNLMLYHHFKDNTVEGNKIFINHFIKENKENFKENILSLYNDQKGNWGDSSNNIESAKNDENYHLMLLLMLDSRR